MARGNLHFQRQPGSPFGKNAISRTLKCQVSSVKCHIRKHFNFFTYLFIFLDLIGQICSASWSRFCYQRGLPRLSLYRKETYSCCKSIFCSFFQNLGSPALSLLRRLQSCVDMLQPLAVWRAGIFMTLAMLPANPKLDSQEIRRKWQRKILPQLISSTTGGIYLLLLNATFSVCA